MDRTTPALRWKSSRRSQRAVGHVAQQTEPSYFLPPLGPQLASTAPHPPADRSRSPDRAPSAGSSGPHPAHTNELYTLIKGVNRLAHLPNESVQSCWPKESSPALTLSTSWKTKQISLFFSKSSSPLWTTLKVGLGTKDLKFCSCFKILSQDPVSYPAESGCWK
ncbi:hypothetical protein DL93DRAFT_577395 [Clavulina sp. PMI_390]|nr:hypothetical protein DL93DRAFT_577395 [Clavulina sp. PMI_390]